MWEARTPTPVSRGIPSGLLARVGDERGATAAQGAGDHGRRRSSRVGADIPQPPPNPRAGAVGPTTSLVPPVSGRGPGNTTRRVTQPAWRSCGRLALVPGGGLHGRDTQRRRRRPVSQCRKLERGAGSCSANERWVAACRPVVEATTGVGLSLVGTGLAVTFPSGCEIGW